MTRATNRDKNRSVMFTFHEIYKSIYVEYVTPRLVFLLEWAAVGELGIVDSLVCRHARSAPIWRHTWFTPVTPIVMLHPIIKAIVSDFHMIDIQSFDRRDVSSIDECEELLAVQNRRQWAGLQFLMAPVVAFHLLLHVFGPILEVLPIVLEPRHEGGSPVFSTAGSAGSAGWVGAAGGRRVAAGGG